MEAPERCLYCPTGMEYDRCKYKVWEPGKNMAPGPTCPFVLLAAKDAAIRQALAVMPSNICGDWPYAVARILRAALNGGEGKR